MLRAFRMFLGLFGVVGLVACGSHTGIGPDSEGDAVKMVLAKPTGGVATAYPADAGSGTFAGYNETNNPDYGIYTYSLWAGKTNNAGSVIITNDDQNLYVTYNTNATADLSEVHVYVWTNLADIPSKRPAPGQALYKAENIHSDSYTLAIPMSLACGQVFYVSAHAALEANQTANDEAGTGSNAGETAYAGGANVSSGFPAGTGSWWGYISYTVTCFYDISGTLYNDADNSANYESDEAGFGGLAMNLLDANGAVVATTITNSDGSYLVEHAAGNMAYQVVAIGPEGYQATENAGGYAHSDLNADQIGIDFGFYRSGDATTGGGEETAYAVGDRTFIDLGITNSRWGWQLTVGVGSGTAPIYAGAGRNDLTKGTHVGNLNYSYDGHTLTLNYQMFAGYALTQTHVYAGNANVAITAPGQYGHQHSLSKAGSDGYSIPLNDDGDGVIYVVAHGVVVMP